MLISLPFNAIRQSLCRYFSKVRKIKLGSMETLTKIIFSCFIICYSLNSKQEALSPPSGLSLVIQALSDQLHKVIQSHLKTVWILGVVWWVKLLLRLILLAMFLP